MCVLSGAVHALRGVPHHHSPDTAPIETGGITLDKNHATGRLVIRYLLEIIVALALTLAGVALMVYEAELLGEALRIPDAILGLVILAVATSLPNTVVAFDLAHEGRATTSVEEVFSSNSINAALGIALPLLFWHSLLQDRILLWLDTPLMVALTLVALLCVYRGRVSRVVALLFALVYIVWVGVHLVMHFF